MSEVISSFKNLRAGSQVFAPLMSFLCVILHTMWLGKSLLCILPFGMLCLSVINMMFVKIMLAVCMVIQKLKHSSIGCPIGRTYCGVFGYANDLAIASSTLLGLRQMIKICEEYASGMDLLFNPKGPNYYVIRCETCC